METLNIQQPAKSISNKALWAGRIISGLCISFLIMDAVMKIALNHYHVEGTVHFGWTADAVQPIGFVLLICTILYIIPRTSLIGAIVLTAYLGGAVATMARIGEAFYFPMIVGVMVWLGLYLRNKKLRDIIAAFN